MEPAKNCKGAIDACGDAREQVPRVAARTTGHPEMSEPVPVIDISTALALLAAAVKHKGADFVYQPTWIAKPRYLTCLYANRDAPDCIVGQALALAGVAVRDLEAMSDDAVVELYLRRELPVVLTLGALVVFDAAQQSQDRGCRWGEVLARATAAAARFVDLVPDAKFRTMHDSSTKSPLD